MINLFDKGLPNAICCFGTKNIDADKLCYTQNAKCGRSRYNI